MSTNEDLIEVHLLRLPLDVLMRARQHSDEVTREFAHIVSPATDQERVPERLLQLSHQLSGQYASYSGSVMDEVEAATERGEKHMDVVYRLPPSAGDGARLLGEMWDAVDAFCRDGEMLSLETPAEAKLFRRWFLDQFITQSQGGSPVSWPDYRTRRWRGNITEWNARLLRSCVAHTSMPGVQCDRQPPSETVPWQRKARTR